MIPVDQTCFGQPEGNCWTACVASILEVSIDDLQPLQDVYVRQSQIALDGGAWDETPLLAALRQLGYTAIGFPPEMQPSGLAIAEGRAPNGTRHACVALNGEVAHDPHPSRAGLAEVEWYTVLLLTQ